MVDVIEELIYRQKTPPASMFVRSIASIRKDEVSKKNQLYIHPVECIDCGMRSGLPGDGYIRSGRPAGEVAELYSH
jgi:hypothetical protein